MKSVLLFCLLANALIPREPYPWETHQSPYPPITKAYFRCKGAGDDPADCDGWTHHGLPLKNREEFIYPILIDLLNYVQDQSGKEVVITSGHRCPKHNTFCDPSKENETSKHLIGAEVDFYVKGLEHNPEEVIDLLIQYYRNSRDELRLFSRWQGKTNVSTSPWYNHEVFIKLFKQGEGRNVDNDHPFPYIAIQVRRDLETGDRVSYTWKSAHLGYQRN